jgi:RNA polymerase sigma-B factor
VSETEIRTLEEKAALPSPLCDEGGGRRFISNTADFSQADVSQLVRKYIPLVRQIARRYSQFNPDSMEDLVQVGSIGLLKAVKYYDPNRTRSASFKTLATCYIRGEIRHYLRDHCSLVQVPRKLTEMNAQLTQIEEKLTKKLARTPTTHELAAASGYSVPDILEAQQSWEARIHYESFDSVGDEEERDDRRSLSEMVPDRKYQDWQHASEERELVTQALKRLGERTREIVEFVFFYDLSQKETASVLGLSEMGVSRAVHSALNKLRDMLKTEAR